VEVDTGGAFASLAQASGFTERECQVAALTGRLGDIVRVAEKRKHTAARRLSGWEALALVEERIRRENLHRLELLRLKAYAPL
jgi:hypothetical protein